MISLDSPSLSEQLGGKAIDLLRAGVFPEWWSFVPVAGKACYVKEWTTKPLQREDCITQYKLRRDYAGLGVVTGAFSGGLIALDVDGHEADERYRGVAGEEYETPGAERTMAWTSGKPGRRQILYRVPAHMVEELAHVKTVILRIDDGEWHLGHGDTNRAAGGEKVEGTDKPYEEVVLRFNSCQSVVPGSRHPETKKLYQWLSYKEVAEAPIWILDVLRGFRKPMQWLTDAQQKALDAELGETAIPSRQIRGWFFKEEVQRLLLPRLEELVFQHETFDSYGWKTREGNNPQRMSGCPWHGGSSGTTFQYSTLSGCWDCKACGVGGDLLDFVHKTRVGDKHAGKPLGPDLEAYVAEIAGKLGFDYPACAKAVEVTTKEVPRVVMTEREFHEALIKIHDSELNPAIRVGRMAGLAAETGRRLTGTQCLAAMDEYRYYEDSKRQNEKKAWWQGVERMEFLVPNLLMKPTQVMLHAAGGLGKTSACMGIATAVGRGTPIKIRGIELPVKQGPVLWIQNDQNPAKLLQDCEDNGIDPEKDTWFIVKRGFQINHTHEFAAWIEEYRPALVVVDSIGSCSTKMQVEEKDKAFASPFYFYAEKNGDPDNGFPATSIIWIHHDNANGEARGTRYLVAAVDEQWHLRTTSDDEREALRERRHSPSNCRMIQIKKSRLGRQGDLLVVERDQDFAYSVWDYTPTERREDQGQGDPEPNTMALRIVKDRVQRARGEDGAGKDRLTAKEVWEALVGEMTGQGRTAPSSKTVKRWLERWVTNGVLVEGKPLSVEGQNKPAPSYTLPTTPLSRALPITECLLTFQPRERLQEQGILNGHAEAAPEDVRSTPTPHEGGVTVAATSPVLNGHRPEQEQDVRSKNPVPEGDLGVEGTTDTFKRATRARDHAFDEPGLAGTAVAPLHEEGLHAGAPVGAEVLGGQDPSGAALGDVPAVEVHDGRAPDRADAAQPQPGSPVRRHELDVPGGSGLSPECADDWGDFDFG